MGMKNMNIIGTDGQKFGFRTLKAVTLSALLVAGTALAPAFATDAADAVDDQAVLHSADDPMTIVISLSDQQMNVYRGLDHLSSSRVSTGKDGHSTPAGVYTILGKNRHHRSNIYSRAPMPFMQRLTWSGIALHAGRVPDYPASHGCVRLPEAFARELFGITEIGVHVVIADGEATPQLVDHVGLFQPPSLVAQNVAVAELGSADATDAVASVSPVADFDAEIPEKAVYELRSTSPVRILITRRTGREQVKDVQLLLTELGYEPGEADGYMGPNTGNAILAFQRDRELQPTGAFSEELLANLHRFAGRGEVPSAHIYVRQDYIDIFDEPITMSDPEELLGTHVYTAMDFVHDGEAVNWVGITLKDAPVTDMTSALDRFDLPEDIRERISDMLTPGSSLIISDAGLGRETGKGTDFLVQP